MTGATTVTIGRSAGKPTAQRNLRLPPELYWASPLIGAVVACGLFVLDYHVAASSPSSQAKFLLFWAAFAAAVLPAAMTVLSKKAPGYARMVSLGAMAAASYLPKVLRSPTRPGFIDELLHYWQVQHLLSTGNVFSPNQLLPVLRYYPGLSLAQAGVHYIFGLSAWDAGLALVAVAHLATVAGLYILARQVSMGQRAAATAALIYMLSPGFTFFTTEVAYESIGLPLAIFAIVAALAAGRASGRPRAAWAALSWVMISAAVVTHHVSAIVAAGVLVVLAAAAWLWHDGPEDSSAGSHRALAGTSAPVLGALAIYGVAANAVWIGAWDWGIISYLLPGPSRVLADIGHVLSGATGSRQVFARSSLPVYEKVLGILAPPLVTALAALGATYGRALSPRRALRGAFIALAAMYPLSIPLDLSATAQVWSHRSWPYLWIGLAPLAAAGVLWALDDYLPKLSLAARPGSGSGTGRHRPTAPRSTSGRRDVATSALASLVLLAVLVGSTADDVNEQVRFPSTYVLGANSGSSTPQMLQAARWFGSHAKGATVLGDFDTEANFAVYGGAKVDTTFPTWVLTFSPATTGRRGALLAQERHIGWLAVDKLIYTQVSLRGYIYSRYEPQALVRTKPLGWALWSQLKAQPWAALRYQNSQMAIFQLVPTKLGQPSSTGRGHRARAH